MKKKFEENVASELPKTNPDEPGLPWKLEEADLAKVDSESKEYHELAQGEPPLKTRALMVVVLLAAIFAAVFFIVTTVTVENDKIKIDISKKEKEAASLQVDLDKAATEKAALEKNASQLEKRVNDLSTQKELFTAVLESLTKKGEAPAPESSGATEPASDNTAQAEQEAGQ
jgi:septal ring factor EnvC (AmiA/AmiB activator)